MATKKKAKVSKKVKKVNPIPKGYHSITPGLAIRNADQAIEFYKKAFGAKEKMRMPGPDGKIMHAEIHIGDSAIYIGEEMPLMGHHSPQSLNGTTANLHIYVKNADKVFEQAVTAGATVVMPMEDAFWGDRYGQLQDPFGHRWGVATHKKDLSEKEMRKTAQEFFSKMDQQQ
jgi:PhnB protein